MRLEERSVILDLQIAVVFVADAAVGRVVAAQPCLPTVPLDSRRMILLGARRCGGCVGRCSRFGRCGQHIAAAGRFEQGARIEGGGQYISLPDIRGQFDRPFETPLPVGIAGIERLDTCDFGIGRFGLFDGTSVVDLEIDVGRHPGHVAVIDGERDRSGCREAEFIEFPALYGRFGRRGGGVVGATRRSGHRHGRNR